MSSMWDYLSVILEKRLKEEVLKLVVFICIPDDHCLTSISNR